MRAHHVLRPFALCLTICSMVVACSSTPPPSHKDAGSAGCAIDADCPEGDLCIETVCHPNSCEPGQNPTGCPDGYTCDALHLMCFVNGDGGTPDDGGPQPGDGGMSGCASKYDCPGGQICVAGACKAAASDGPCVRDDQCPSGFVCNFSHKCEAGCGTDRDCVDPQICNQTTVTCEACSRSNPCAAGKTCSNGVCAATATCMTSADCQAKQAGLVCTSGSCGNCSKDVDCHSAPFDASYVCSSGGLCTMSGCTDAGCKGQFGAKAYCDSSTMSCQQYQCTVDSDCTSPATCNMAAHVCTTSTMCDVAQCNTACQQSGTTCDTNTCSCMTGPACNPQGTGQPGDTCSVDCDCSSGLACDPLMSTCGTGGSGQPGMAVKPDGSPCDIGSCIAGGCVDAGDHSIMCAGDPITCFLGALTMVFTCN